MKSIRLLPVVIFAAAALLLFKGIGLLTTGGYVLTGPVAAIAQDHAAAPAAGGASDPTLISELTLADSNPTLGDTAPTIGGSSESSAAGGEAAPAAESGPPPPAADATAASESVPVAAVDPAAAVACPDPAASSSAPAAEGGHASPAAAPVDCVSSQVAVDAHGDAIPTVRDANGQLVPLPTADGSEAALLQRLGERRAELDKREQDLALRTALVQAAEQKLDERTKQLADLQAQVNALVDQKQAAEDAGFKAVVSMYETMKPKDAAKIFDTLDLPVLLKVARAMNPRKMSPVLAAMSPGPAQALTTALATPDPRVATDTGGENLAALPQIVGK